MVFSLVAAALLLGPTAAVLVGVLVSGRRDRARARAVAAVLAEFRTRAPGPAPHPGGPDGGPAEQPPEAAPTRLAQVIPFPGAERRAA
jgi:hypothetical protein